LNALTSLGCTISVSLRAPSVARTNTTSAPDLSVSAANAGEMRRTRGQ
jgi:hypothetical protein